MASLSITESDISDQTGKTAIITGGSSGIGLATAKILAHRGAHVHILDVTQPEATFRNAHYHACDVTRWEELRDVVDEIGQVDYAFANAGVSDTTDYLTDHLDNDDRLLEPDYTFLDVNLRAVFNFVKVSWSKMRQNQTSGSIVITTSATGYAPEQALPIYSSARHALVGLIRALRSVLAKDNITINGVAPAATMTNLLPEDLAAPILAQGLPVSDAHFVGLALAYSATAVQSRRVEAYGKEKEEEKWAEERWNGRVILTLGNTYTELEESLADLRPFWFGRETIRLTRLQQAATDFR